MFDNAIDDSSGGRLDAGGGDQIRILVVDDERLMRDLMVMSLQRLGYAVSAAADGATALQMLERE